MKHSLLFICLGNICRSPAAEGVMRQMAERRRLGDSIVVDSAGIGAWHVGEQPDHRMCSHARRRGYDLTTLRARQFSSRDFLRFDYIVVMDEENYRDVMRQKPAISHTPHSTQAAPHSAPDTEVHLAEVLRMKDFFIEHKGQPTVPDPYYGGAEGFELALDLIEDGCQGLLDYLCTGK